LRAYRERAALQPDEVAKRIGVTTELYLEWESHATLESLLEFDRLLRGAIGFDVSQY
jgi:DNA-binding transcriptional regulator YiaG